MSGSREWEVAAHCAASKLIASAKAGRGGEKSVWSLTGTLVFLVFEANTEEALKNIIGRGNEQKRQMERNRDPGLGINHHVSPATSFACNKYGSRNNI